jgi:hypothetical protein
VRDLEVKVGFDVDRKVFEDLGLEPEARAAAHEVRVLLRSITELVPIDVLATREANLVNDIGGGALVEDGGRPNLIIGRRRGGSGSRLGEGRGDSYGEERKVRRAHRLIRTEIY